MSRSHNKVNNGILFYFWEKRHFILACCFIQYMNKFGMDELTFTAFSVSLFSVCEIEESFGASSCRCMNIIVTLWNVCVIVRERGRKRERNITASFKDRSNTLCLCFFLLITSCRIKCFWAWLATWAGDLVITKLLEIPFQSPLPSFFNPIKNSLCSSSVHRLPKQTNNKVFYKVLITIMSNNN